MKEHDFENSGKVIMDDIRSLFCYTIRKYSEKITRKRNSVQN